MKTRLKPSSGKRRQAYGAGAALLRENKDLRARLAEAEETLGAIRSGAVDAVVVATPSGDQVFTLQGAERPYRLLVEEMSEGALLLNPDGVILYANARFASWVKVPLMRVSGSRWADFFASEDRERLQLLLRAARRTLAREELTLKAYGGSPQPVGVSLRWLEREQLSFYSAVITDLTENRRTQQILRESAGREKARRTELELLLELVPTPLWIAHDRECLQVTANKAARELMRAKEGEVLTMSAPENLRPKIEVRRKGKPLRPEEMTMQRAAATGQAVMEDEVELVYPDGSSRYIVANAVPLFDENGQVRGCLGAPVDITKDYLREQALRQSEERFRAFFNTDAVGTAQLSPDGRFLQVNQRLSQMTGYSTEELLQMTPGELTHPEDRLHEDQKLVAHLDGRSPTYHAEKRYVRKDGEVIWVEVAAALVRDLARKPVRSVGVIQDVTQRKAAEAALRASEQRFRQLSEQSPDFIALHDLQLRHLYVNPAIANLFGRAQDAFVGRTPRETGWPAEAMSQIERMLQQTLATDAECREDFVLRTPGGLRYILWRSVPLRDPEGKTYAVLTNSTDITERKGAEEALRAAKQELARANANLELVVDKRTAELKRANQSLQQENEQRKRVEQAVRESEERYRGLVEVSPNAICICRNDRLVFVNDAALRLLGASEVRQVLSRTPCELFPEPESKVHKLLRQKPESGKLLLRLEDRLARLDGTMREVEVAVCAFAEQGGTSVQLVVHDITERKLVERRVLAAVDEERQRLGRELHDGLCQLLTGTKFKISLLERKLASNRSVRPSQLRALEADVNHAIEHARAMAYGLNPLKLVAHGLVSALEKLAASVRDSAGVHCVCECESPVSVADQETALHLYRIAQEAVQNGLKHGQARNVRIELKAQREDLCLTVRDDGTGIPASAELHPGMGILNMKARAELMGGRLEIGSIPGGGTLVTCVVRYSGAPNQTRTE